MKYVIFPLLLIVLGCITPVSCTVKSIQFRQDCSGYLKQAADANTVEISLERINKALAYIEAHELTEGYTSVLWRTEDENIGFWYNNIKACNGELESCLNGTQLEKSNVLMKVRESLTDNGEKGTVLTIPDGISRYPNNAAYGIGGFLSFLAIVVGVVWLSCFINEEFDL